MRSVSRVLGAAAFVLVVPACGGVEPLGPTPLDQGIVVFSHSGYRGTSQQVGTDVPDLTRVEGPCNVGDEGGAGSWNDCISSIRLLPGYSARLYGDRNFRGAVVEVTQDIPDLSAIRGDCSGSYDDCISSIRVLKRP
jgi:hypothetical protein